MSLPQRRIAVFMSTFETLRAEKAFKEERIKVRATIKPRTISSSCQMALTFPEQCQERIAAIVLSESLDVVGYYQRDSAGNWLAL